MALFHVCTVQREQSELRSHLACCEAWLDLRCNIRLQTGTARAGQVANPKKPPVNSPVKGQAMQHAASLLPVICLRETCSLCRTPWPSCPCACIQCLKRAGMHAASLGVSLPGWHGLRGSSWRVKPHCESAPRGRAPPRPCRARRGASARI